MPLLMACSTFCGAISVIVGASEIVRAYSATHFVPLVPGQLLKWDYHGLKKESKISPQNGKRINRFSYSVNSEN